MIETLLEVRNLSKTFRYRTGWFRRPTGAGCGRGGAFPLTLTLSPEGRGDRIVQILLPQQQTGSYSP